MLRKVNFGLHEMREIPTHDKKIAKTLSHWSNRLPKQVVVTRSGVQMDNGIINVHQAKGVLFHEYQVGEPNDIIMEEDRFRRVYRFVTKQVWSYIERREEARLRGVVVKKNKSGRTRNV